MLAMCAVASIYSAGASTPFQLRPLAKILTIPMVKRFKGSDYGEIRMLPTNFVVDRKGILRCAQAGGFTLDAMSELLGPLSAESAD